VGWKYYLVIICWSVFFLPSKLLIDIQATSPDDRLVIYFFFPETARLTLEEIAKKFGEDVAVHVTDATEEERMQLEMQLEMQLADSDRPNEEHSEEKVVKTV
jgi:hypothetical protein